MDSPKKNRSDTVLSMKPFYSFTHSVNKFSFRVTIVIEPLTKASTALDANINRCNEGGITMTTRSQVKIEWMTIPAGTAKVGSTLQEIDKANEFWQPLLLAPEYTTKFKDWLMKEYPQHEVQLSSFEMSDILVTNELYQEFCEETGTELPESIWNEELKGEPNHPAWGMSFSDAKQFCAWYSTKVGYEVKLPTEPQWEYAARGGTVNEYPWGEGFDPSKCNTVEADIGITTPVRQYPEGRSLFHIYDMGGNVEEWVDTGYGAYPGGEVIVDDLVDALGMQYPVLKGGSFARGGDLARVARRHGGFPDPIFRFTGFRLVRAVQE
jgi:toxoflavin biosynthesis protein ToxD